MAFSKNLRSRIFKDRIDAGRELAAQLTAHSGRDHTVVLGIPRGGVPVAFEIATALRLPLDVFLARKLGVPGNPELAFGALAADGTRILDDELVASAGISTDDIEALTAAAMQMLQQRSLAYRGTRPPLAVTAQTVILVDDGIATGASMLAAVQALRSMQPAKIIVAAPVAPRSTCERLRPPVDELVVVECPHSFFAVGQFYDRFDQTSDAEVTALLGRHSESLRHPK